MYCQHKHQLGFVKMQEDRMPVIAIHFRGKIKRNSILDFFGNKLVTLCVIFVILIFHIGLFNFLGQPNMSS